MTHDEKHESRSRIFLRWLFAAAFIFAVVFSGILTGLKNIAGLFYLVFGSVAVAFMGFPAGEIGAAFRHAAGRVGPREEVARSAYFWEAAARNAWMLGALGTAMNFTIALGSESGGIADISNRMIQSFVITLYGLVLAVICLVPAMKLRGKTENLTKPGPAPAAGVSESGAARSSPVESVAGYVLFAAVLTLTVFSLIKGYPQNGPLPVAKVLLHGSAFLVVLGGAVAMALFMGTATGAKALTLGFAMTGLVGLFTGLIQALFGFVHANIREISSAIAFIISASFLALLGLVAVAAPLEDREVTQGRRESSSSLSRMSWIVFPLLSLIFLLLTFIMVITPMKKPGG